MYRRLRPDLFEPEDLVAQAVAAKYFGPKDINVARSETVQPLLRQLQGSRSGRKFTIEPQWLFRLVRTGAGLQVDALTPLSVG